MNIELKEIFLSEQILKKINYLCKNKYIRV